MNKLAQQMVGFVQTTSQALGLALTMAKQAHVAKQAASEVIPQVVDKLVSSGLIAESLRKEATKQLADHANALEVLENAVCVMEDRLKAAQQQITALNTGAPDGPPSKIKSASTEDDPDMALMALVPSMADRYQATTAIR